MTDFIQVSTLYHRQRENTQDFSSNLEALASRLLENLAEMFLLFFNKHRCVIRLKVLNNYPSILFNVNNNGNIYIIAICTKYIYIIYIIVYNFLC